MKTALLEPLGMRDTHFVVPVSFHISLLRIKFLDLFVHRDVCGLSVLLKRQVHR